ncbi:MAG: hypothetical protein QM535_18800 [Limnohabitans sp.]|nr:hypothetical protein [Limnohabitans sp.]
MAKKIYNNDNLPTSDEVKKFEMLFPMLDSDVAEIRELSKKKQDEPLNSFKVKIINKKLGQIKELLKNEPAGEYLELLDEDTLPTNSDAVLMITQFINAMGQFKKKYYESDGSDIDVFGAKYTWKTKT